ncbi:UNKNOWN [Stylonychia lemnae]|uniref:Uncharacterized protein n=1 Tax=Stylonychia lemnae TaxID=5949 RepID=A0A078BBJ6_STYLE|nr:UNKNOWN [Stylonychia lemnae]|eukprot:CDW90933.1 UNKNOWN [Stylonychia lemnae]
MNRELQNAKKTIQQRDQELSQMAKIKASKKEYEQLVIKASQEIKRKEEECEEKNIVIAKAQEVIIKITEELETMIKNNENDRVRLQEQHEKEVMDLKHQLNELQTQKINVEINLEQITQESSESKKSNEEKILEIQKKADEIISFYKGELQKLKQINELQLQQQQKQSMLQKSKSQDRLRLNDDNARQNRLGQTLPNKRNDFKQSPPRISTKLQNPTDLQIQLHATLKHNVQTISLIEQSQLLCLNLDETCNLKDACNNIVLEAYLNAIDEIKFLKEEMQLFIKDHENKILIQSDQSQELARDYTERIEMSMNREQNLKKLIDKKDTQIQSLSHLIKSLNQALKDQKQYSENFICQVYSKQEIYAKMEQELLSYIETLKSVIQQHVIEIKQLQGTLSQQKQTATIEYEEQSTQIEKIMTALNEERLKNDTLEQENEKLYKQVEEEIQQRSFIQYSLDKTCENIKEIWQDECEAFIKTEQIVHIQAEENVEEMLRDIKEQLMVQKQMNDLQKEECYQLLQQINEYSEITNQLNTSGQFNTLNMSQTQPNQLLFEGTQNSIINPSLQSIEQYHKQAQTLNYKYGSSKLMQTLPLKGVVVGQSQLYQSKRNELYNMLRDEIKRMQSELNNRKEQMVHIKKQYDQSEKAYRQKCDEYQTLYLDNQELLKVQFKYQNELIDMESEKQNIFKDLNEKENQLNSLQTQVELFTKDLEIIQKQMADMIDQNNELLKQKDYWRDAVKHLEQKLNESDQDKIDISEQFNDQIEQVKEKVNKYKDRCHEKDQQIYDLHMKLQSEVNLNQEVAEQLESKQYSLKNTCIQTDPDPDYLQLIIDNQNMQKEIDHIKNDVNTILDSYDLLKKDCNRLNDIISDQSDEIKRLETEKVTTQETLDKEREFLQRVKKLEKSYNNIVGGTSQQSQSSYFAGFPDDLIDERDSSIIDPTFYRLKEQSTFMNDPYFNQSRHSKSLNRANNQKQNSTQNFKLSFNELDRNKTIKDNRQFVPDFQASQQVFNVYQTQDIPNSRNIQEMINRKQRNGVEDPYRSQQIFNYNDRSHSAMSMIRPSTQMANHSYNKENNFHISNQANHFDSQALNYPINNHTRSTLDQQAINNQTNCESQQRQEEETTRYRKKCKRLMRHIDAIINYLLVFQNQAKDDKLHKPPRMNKNQSKSRLSKQTSIKEEPSEEILFYQAQTYFYHKNQDLYHKVQSLLKQNQNNDSINQFSWSLIQTSRKLTSLCLDGAVLLNDQKFQQFLKQSQEFLQKDSTFISQNFEQLNNVNDRMIEGIAKIVSHQSNKIILNQYQTVQSESSNISSISYPDILNINKNSDLGTLQKLKQVEQRLQFNQDILGQLQDYLQQSSLSSLSKSDNEMISPESIWKLVCSIQRLVGGIKLELNYDVLTLGQTTKKIQTDLNDKKQSINGNQYSAMPSYDSKAYKNENLVSIIREIYDIDMDKIQLPQKYKSLNSNFNTLQSQQALINEFDRKFSQIDEKQIARFMDRLIVRLRKDTIQSNKIKTIESAINEVDSNIKETLNQKRRTSIEHQHQSVDSAANSEYALLLLLKENLELRQQLNT